MLADKVLYFLIGIVVGLSIGLANIPALVLSILAAVLIGLVWLSERMDDKNRKMFDEWKRW